jgi:hypothetical protein
VLVVSETTAFGVPLIIPLDDKERPVGNDPKMMLYVSALLFKSVALNVYDAIPLDLSYIVQIVPPGVTHCGACIAEYCVD